MVTDVENKATTAVLSAVDTVTEYTHIPLRDPNKMDDHLEDFKETLLKKAQSFSDDTDQLADDLIKDTDDIINEEVATAVSTAKDVTSSLPTIVNDQTPTHSLDSLRTSSPDPEIENALLNVVKSSTSPQPTFNEMSEITTEYMNDKSSNKEDSVPDVQWVQTTLILRTKFFCISLIFTNLSLSICLSNAHPRTVPIVTSYRH